MSTLKTDLFFLLGLLAALAALNFRVLFEGHAFALVDCSLFFLPLWKWGSVSLAKGILPLWNPDAAFGTPYLADPETACFYPPVALCFQLFSPANALNILVLGHYLWALLGFWIYGRYKKWEPWALFLGCVVFGFSVNAISLPLATTMLFTFSWVPWIFWSVERLFNNEKWSFACFSMALAMQMVSGYPLYCYLTLLALFFEIAAGILADKKKLGILLESWKKLTAAGLAALAYNFAWLLPFWEFKQLSNTEERLGFTTDVTWPYLATWLNPFYMGHPLHSYKGLHPAVGNYFFGLPVAVLLILLILSKKGRSATLWVFLLLMVLSLGKTALLGEWFRHFIPGFSWAVRSGYIISIIGFYVARLSCESASLLFKEMAPKSRDAGVFFMVTAAVYLSALFLGVPADLESFWVSFVLMLMVALRNYFSARTRWVALVLALVLSLWPVIRTLNFTVPKPFYEKAPDFLANLNKPGRIFHTHAVISYYWSLPGNSVQDVYQKMKFGLISNWPLTYGLEETYFNNSFYLRSYADWEFPAMRFSEKISRKVLDYLNVRYVFGDNSFRRFRALNIGTTVTAFENLTVLPKWHSIQTGFARRGWDEDMQMADKDSFDFGKCCFTPEGTAAGAYSKRFVRETFRSINRLELETDGLGRSLLVSSETDYPGWKARVDGKERLILDVNYGFRGLLLEKGEKKVEMFYRPISFRVGCFFLLLACGYWMALILKGLIPERFKNAGA